MNLHGQCQIRAFHNNYANKHIQRNVWGIQQGQKKLNFEFFFALTIRLLGSMTGLFKTRFKFLTYNLRWRYGMCDSHVCARARVHTHTHTRIHHGQLSQERSSCPAEAVKVFWLITGLAQGKLHWKSLRHKCSENLAPLIDVNDSGRSMRYVSTATEREIYFVASSNFNTSVSERWLVVFAKPPSDRTVSQSFKRRMRKTPLHSWFVQQTCWRLRHR